MTPIAPFGIGKQGECSFGCGVIQELPDLVRRIGAQNVFIVTDPGVVAAGVCGTVQHTLERAGIEVAVFDGIHPNPSTHTLDAGAESIRAFGARGRYPVVVALGGGAVLDASKGLALMAVNEGSARDFDYSRDPERDGLPLIAVPTTAGTGSETNAFGVIDDPEAGRKFYVGHASVLPRFVVLDPELTVGLPHGATAAAGMDALAHALESLSSVRSNPYAEALNLQVVGMIARSLPHAVADGKDLEARSQMLLASYLAGLAFATTGLGLAHAIGHALSARIGAPHGVALAVLLPHVLRFNLPERQGPYAWLAEALGATNAGGDEMTRALASINAVARLEAAVGLPRRLGELGLTDGHLPQIVEDALADEVLLNTPRQPTASDMAVLLRNAL